MPNRILRDWTTSEKIDNLSFEAEVMFTRLIMKADDHGCFHANLKLLKAAIFPLKDVSTGMIAIYLKELCTNEIVNTYEVEGREYLQIANFGQRLRTMNSKFPLPVSNPLSSVSNEPPETKRSRNEVETSEKGIAQTKDYNSIKELSVFIALAYKKKYNRDEGGEIGQDIDYMSERLLKTMTIDQAMDQIRNHKLYTGSEKLTLPSKIETIQAALLETDWIQRMKEKTSEEVTQSQITNEQARNKHRNGSGVETIAPAYNGRIDPE